MKICDKITPSLAETKNKKQLRGRRAKNTE